MAVAVPLRIEAWRREARETSVRTLELTGLMRQGVWTDERVTAANSWRGNFRPARPVLVVGEPVRIRLTSADVVHAISIPGLGIAPVEVYPGRYVEIVAVPREVGAFPFYCTTVCGDAHFAMRGVVQVVEAPGAIATPPPEQPGGEYWRAEAPRADAGMVARGAWLFRRQGCVTCHGEEAGGGVANPGAMNANVPALADLARRTFLFTPSDAASLVRALERGPLAALEEAPEIPLYAAVKKQYLATHQIVASGRKAAPMDPASPPPPLEMPAWEARLTGRDIDSVLAYLLTLSQARAAIPAADPGSRTVEGVKP
ncbi:MAG: c-type cytochrome [Thermoanaerobaculia bacterium]|nr:c-type cytochrome [Thermoanaerobaculia bacterium]